MISSSLGLNIIYNLKPFHSKVGLANEIQSQGLYLNLVFFSLFYQSSFVEVEKCFY